MSSLPAITGTEAVAETRWLQLKTLTYLDGKGSERKWDFVQRPNGGARIDAVCVATRLLGGVYTEPHIILVRQFRPPTGKHTIELPAGLVDAGETLEAAALRELKEETGYVGTVSSVSAGMPLSPGLSNESVAIVAVDVDTRADGPNAKPVQELEETEDISVHVVAVSGLKPYLAARTKAGDAVFFGLHTLAMTL